MNSLEFPVQHTEPTHIVGARIGHPRSLLGADLQNHTHNSMPCKQDRRETRCRTETLRRDVQTLRNTDTTYSRGARKSPHKYLEPGYSFTQAKRRQGGTCLSTHTCEFEGTAGRLEVTEKDGFRVGFDGPALGPHDLHVARPSVEAGA